GLHILHPFKAVEGRIGLYGDCAYVRIELFQAARRAYESARRAQSIDEVRDAPLGLLPYFRRGSAILREPVFGIVVLIRVKIFVRLALCHTASDALRAVR